MIYRQIKLNKNYGYYFPLFNSNGFKSTITPNLLGDIKFDYNHFVTEPISEIGLYESLGRHVIIIVDNDYYYLSGKSLFQQHDEVEVTYGSIYQKVKRINEKHEIEIKTFIPHKDNIELSQIKYLNTTNNTQKVKIITAPMLYGRSLDNLFDHRHVTSLLNRAKVIKGGILLKPTLSFDERGHILNHTSYYFLTNSNKLEIDGYYPSYDEFIDGGTMLFPKGLNNKYQVGDTVDGYETLGGVSYKEITINPNEELTFYIAFGISEDDDIFDWENLKEEEFRKLFNETKKVCENYFNQMQFSLRDKKTSNFLNFIEVQPYLRRTFGNSYLPHHDYGNGGRGWRDLFQDLLFMIINFDSSVKNLLINNFKGVRIDGSNATIIGNKLGEFKADRNNITRVWSDHAVWPLLAIDDYIRYFNDYEILDEEVSYFDDKFTHLTKKVKNKYDKNNVLKANNKIYKGTILEHLLLQNIVFSFNLGEKGFVRLEDADWNDGLDMANKLGETIAFTHFYINNLKILNKYLKRYDKVLLFKDLGNLILRGSPNKLNDFFDKVSQFKGEKEYFQTSKLIEKIEKHIHTLTKNIKDKALMENGALQSYIDNDGKYLDKNTISLTGQAMALLNKTLSNDMANEVAKITKERLYNPDLGGYHLNENYNEVKMNMGRAYGFSYNHKENGAVFSHMALMHAYGLYNYKLTDMGHEAMYGIINRAMKEDSKVPLGIPEYFTEKGHGKYFYLTGSATWLLKLLKEQVFGLKMVEGKLQIRPQMLHSDFINGKASIKTILFGNLVEVIINNPNNLSFPDYKIERIQVDGKHVIGKITQVNKKIEVYLK
jgi:cellobiose phosphorylase